MKSDSIAISIVNEKNRQIDNLAEHKAIVAVCPSFKINTYFLTISISPGRSSRPSKLQLLACAEKIHAKEVCFLVGLSWLYWDCLLLDSLDHCEEATYLATIEEKSSEEKILTLDDNPHAATFKKKAREAERAWVADELKGLPPTSFIYSGDLLDNLGCQKLYKQLSDYCDSKPNAPVALELTARTEKFINEHYASLLERKDVEYKYNRAIPIKTVIKKYMEAYTRFEFAAFVHLALQGFNILLTAVVDEKLFKANNLVMTCFSNPSVLGKPSLLPKQQRMQIAKIEFKGSSPIHSPSSPIPSALPHSPEQGSPQSLPLESESKNFLVANGELTRIFKAIVDLPGVSPEMKMMVIKIIVDRVKILPPEASSNSFKSAPSMEGNPSRDNQVIADVAPSDTLTSSQLIKGAPLNRYSVFSVIIKGAVAVTAMVGVGYLIFKSRS